MTTHNFTDSLSVSRRYTEEPWWEEVYRKAFPSFLSMADIRKDGWAQRGGIDRVVTLASGRTYTVDEKVRRENYDDILLEYWSDIDRRKLGWVAKDLACDFIAYAFAPTKRCYLLPFATLRLAWKNCGDQWVKQGEARTAGFREVRAENSEDGRHWTTVSVACPIPVLMAALKEAMIIRWTA